MSHDYRQSTAALSRTKVDGLKKWEESTMGMFTIVKGDSVVGIGGAEWVEGWGEEWGSSETETGLVVDVSRKDEAMKMDNHVEVSFISEFHLPVGVDYANSERSELGS